MHSRTIGCRKADECASAGQKTIETKTRRYDERHLGRVREQAAWLLGAGGGGAAAVRFRSCAWFVRVGLERVEDGVLVVSLDRLVPALRAGAGASPRPGFLAS